MTPEEHRRLFARLERTLMLSAVMILASVLLGAALGVLAAWRLSQSMPEHAAIGSLLGMGGGVLGTLLGSVSAVIWARRQLRH